MRNMFCNINASSSFPKWNMVDVGLWELLPDNATLVTGEYRLWAYKAAYLKYNRNKIIINAYREKIPVLLLAGVAISEVAGMPERMKAFGVLQFYQLRDYFGSGGNTISNKTSVGSLAIQLRVAAKTLGIDATTLSTTQQLQLANCLLDDDFNTGVVARHLRELIEYDNPGITDTLNISDELITLAASRYNRGVERSKEDFIKSMNANKGDASREYTSYGRSIIKRKDIIYKILEVQK